MVLLMQTTTSIPRTVSAFSTYGELTEACRGGYIPTLQVYRSDSRETVRAKEALIAQLRSDGFPVFSHGKTLGPL
jgi:hypothetical protein